MIKKIIFSLSLCLLHTSLYAAPASTESTEQLLNVIHINQAIEDLAKSETFQQLTQQIIEYYSIPPTKENQTRIYNAIQKYYLSDAYKREFRQNLFNIYNQNMTEEETQQWIKFYKTAVGQSILNNKNFEQKIIDAVEQIFPDNAEPSAQAQAKLTQVMQKFFSQ